VDVEHPEVIAVEHDHPRAGARHRGAEPHQLTQRLRQVLALDPERHHAETGAIADEGSYVKCDALGVGPGGGEKRADEQPRGC